MKKDLTIPPKPRSPELGGAEVGAAVLGAEAAAAPDVLAPELHWQQQKYVHMRSVTFRQHLSN